MAYYDDCPYTNFPTSVDTITRKRDIDLETKTLVDQYYTYVNAGNFTAAAALLESNPELRQTIMSAEDYNKIRDAMIAVERVFNSDIENYIAAVVKPKGTWSATTKYDKYNVVTYSYNNAVRSYICLPSNESSTGAPIGTPPTNTAYWTCITLVGPNGASGTGLSPCGEYNPESTYYPDDLVIYDGKLFTANNEVFGEPPSATSPNWTLLSLVPVDDEASSDVMPYSSEKTDELVNNLQEQINKMNNTIKTFDDGTTSLKFYNAAGTSGDNKWILNSSTGVYTQTIKFHGYNGRNITASDEPEIFFNSTHITTQSGLEQYAEECGYLNKIETIAGGLKATAFDKPSYDILIIVKGV